MTNLPYQMQHRRLNIYIHVGFSLFFMLIPIIFSPDILNWDHLLFTPPFLKDLALSAILLITFYGYYYLFIPKIFENNKTITFISISLLIIILVLILPEILFDVHPNRPRHIPADAFNHRMRDPMRREHLMQLREIGNGFVKFCIVVSMAFLLRYYNKWKQTTEEKLNTELSFLKAQINPHFLFNTLNSIYAQAIQENADQTGKSIVTLSNMMRHVFNETLDNFVTLEAELEYISSYIELQKGRLKNTVEIDFSCQGVIEPNHRIAPMLLISFIENAFKYGILPGKPATLKIALQIKNDHLFVEVSNKKLAKSYLQERSGMGITNASKRMELLYNGKYELNIIETEDSYLVHIKLDLQV